MCQVQKSIVEYRLFNLYLILFHLYLNLIPLQPVSSESNLMLATLSPCMLSSFNLYCWFMKIHKRDEGHGLTFVYFKAYDQSKSCFVPFRTRKWQRRVTWLESIHWHPLKNREMLLVEVIPQPLVPPVCCHLHHRVHPLPYGTLSAQPG